MMQQAVRFWVVLLAAMLCGVVAAGGCSFYGFQAGSIPSNLNTIAVPLVQDNSISPVTTLDRDLTRFFTDRFVNRTRLRLTNNEADADALLSATITSYSSEPTTVGDDDRASANQVTVRVSVQYVDQTKQPTEAMLDREFSASSNYDPVTQGVEGEETAAQDALEQIADDVFSAATSNW
ncbi:LPS assembly lipoprotein LptE [Longibacter sp.]|uniref:LPS assembly lipoprotein LptE n=1 Tax=Longibacter sp. TaxID=2045415 RepID=UPI003EC06CD8